MNREIKFQIWDINMKVFWETLDGLTFRSPKNLEYYDLSTLLLHRTVHEIISRQYTGLKDVNEQEIYEGDIIQFSQEGLFTRHVYNVFKSSIIFENGCFGYMEKKYTIPEFRHLSFWPCMKTVIGNIFENEELLNPTK